MSHNANKQFALVTGAAQRIGAGIASRLHSRGLDVVLHYRGAREAAEQLASDLNQERAGSAVTVAGDLSRAEDIAAMIEYVASLPGDLRVLVNNASGFYPTPMGQVSESHWDDLMSSNLKGAFFLSQGLLPHFQGADKSIVNIIDIHHRRPLKQHGVYSIAKAGLAAMTRVLAKELGPDIRVNGVSPGAILWPGAGMQQQEKEDILSRTALKRQGAVADIAKAVAFLALDADYVTGQIIAVDGGRSLNM